MAQEVTPPGFENVVKGLKANPDVDNPYAIAWAMKNRGYSPKHEAGALARRLKYECMQEGASLAALGFLARKGAK